MNPSARTGSGIWFAFAVRVIFGCVCLWGFVAGALVKHEVWGWALLPLAFLAFGRGVWRLRQLRQPPPNGPR